MAEVTKEEVEFIKECSKLIEKVLPYVRINENFEINISFDKEHALPLIKIKRDND